MTAQCKRIRGRLQDWMDGSVSTRERQEIRSHLDECAGCRMELAAFERLRAEAGRLPREMRPPSDLWPAIESRLELPWWRRLLRPGEAGVEPWRAAPVLALGAAAVALALGLWLWRQSPATRPEGTAVESSRASEALRAQAELARSEDGVLLARRDLLEAVQRQQDHLPPETVAILEENMDIIDQAIGQIRFALEDDPLNHQLHRMLAAHYQQEVHLLKRVSGV